MGDPVKDAKRLLDMQQGFQEIANLVRALYESFIKAGFNEDQAMRLASDVFNKFFGAKHEKP